MRNLCVLLSVFCFFETAGQSSQQSIYARRNNLIHQADSLMMIGETHTFEYLNTLKKIVNTDTDTLLVAANAVGRMKSVYSMSIKDSTYEKMAAAIELQCVDKSLAKYPDNIDGYIYRLTLYKYSTNKEGEIELIKTFQQKFSDTWKMNVTMAHHYILYDFLWPDTKEFVLCSNYLKKAVELNPTDFNSLLLLSVAYENNKEIRMMYLKKLYVLAPQQFSKNTTQNKSKVPFIIQSVKSYPLIGKDLTVGLNVEESKLLNL